MILDHHVLKRFHKPDSKRYRPESWTVRWCPHWEGRIHLRGKKYSRRCLKLDWSLQTPTYGTLGARDFSSAVFRFFSRGFGLRPKMCGPSANNESSRRTRQKPLVPRVLVRELLAPVKGFPDAALLGSRASTWFRPLGVSCCAMKKIFEAFFSSCFSTSDKFVTTANFF